VLDTNVVIGLLKGDPPAIALASEAALDLARAAVSPITRMELLGYPGLTAAEDAVTREFLGHCQVLPIDEAVEAEAIRLRRARAIKLPDAIVLASALVACARLLTLDQRLARLAQASPPSPESTGEARR
jgi:predicted nucleic acid-binding protein